MKRDSDMQVFINAVREYYRNASKAEIIATIMILIGVLNFMTCMAFCINIGGSADNDGIRDGKYFVTEHGKAREVSAFTFKLNKIQSMSLLITHPTAIIGMLILMRCANRSNGKTQF